MAPFAGYNMPIEYTGIKDEHNTVREKVGVFDVSHMGEFWVKGPKAFELVQKITSNDVAAVSYTHLTLPTVSQMKREVSWMTFWYIVSAPRNICWL